MNEQRRKTIIGVIGAGTASAEGEKCAFMVGQLLAREGVTMVCGGLGGIMAAASRGCTEAGGEVIGILPGDSVTDANPYVTLPIVTDMGHARNIIIAHTAQAFIAIEGEYGTLSEMAIALKLGKQVVQLQSWTGMTDAIAAKTPEEAVGLVLATAREESDVSG